MAAFLFTPTELQGFKNDAPNMSNEQVTCKTCENTLAAGQRVNGYSSLRYAPNEHEPRSNVLAATPVVFVRHLKLALPRPSQRPSPFMSI